MLQIGHTQWTCNLRLTHGSFLDALSIMLSKAEKITEEK